ncbi:MAG TPA: hypothetical protein VFR94_00105 [Nitrososphaeraceae archaeon]|nr:hypothetical protein [Nitrososphaeraceae archaeon]
MSQRPEKQQEPQSSSRSANLNTGLENSTYNLISSLEQETKFLYRTINTYIEDAYLSILPIAKYCIGDLKADNENKI